MPSIATHPRRGRRALAAHDHVGMPAGPIVIGLADLDVDALDDRAGVPLAALGDLDRAVGLPDRENALLAAKLFDAPKRGFARRDAIDRHLVELLVGRNADAELVERLAPISCGVLFLNCPVSCTALESMKSCDFERPEIVISAVVLAERG
jgi:hypothetical protein